MCHALIVLVWYFYVFGDCVICVLVAVDAVEATAFAIRPAMTVLQAEIATWIDIQRTVTPETKAVATFQTHRHYTEITQLLLILSHFRPAHRLSEGFSFSEETGRKCGSETVRVFCQFLHCVWSLAVDGRFYCCCRCVRALSPLQLYNHTVIFLHAVECSVECFQGYWYF